MEGKNTKAVLIILILALVSPCLAEPVDVIETMQLEGVQAIVFAAELNISNGNPYTRDYGERGMFGKLVFGDKVAQSGEYLDKSEAIFAEAKRLLLGPWINNGRSDLTFCKVGKGIQLNLDTGEWIKSNGGNAIRVCHVVEYMGGNRRAYILIPQMTIWRRDK